MLTMKGRSSLAPAFLDWEDSGNASLSADCCLNVVVTSKKITSTISTSISATMMTAGVVRRLRTWKRILFLASVLSADEIVAKSFHFHGEHLDLFAEITPCDE